MTTDARAVLRASLAITAALSLSFVLYLASVFAGVVQLGNPSSSGSGRRDVIVVMGAAQYDGRPSAMLEQRLERALALWNDGTAGRIAVTGGNKKGDRFTEAATSARWLTDRGVPEAAILREETGTSTWQSLSNLAAVLRASGVRTAVVVTTDWHAARSTHSLRELGFEVSAAPVGPGFPANLDHWVRETLGVAAGRLIGFGTLLDITG